jgi:hypothetical protein
MKLITTAALVLAATTSAWADAPITIDFEGAVGYVNPIADFYNGGTDGAGNMGPNLGVSFTDAAVGLSNDANFTYYSNAPTSGTVMAAFDTSATMNVASGFSGQLTFWYASSATTLDAVNIYSDLNGTGTLLASASLFGNASLGCSDTAFCRFDMTSVKFAGVAKSVNFGGNAQFVAYDNIGITPVPELNTYVMLAAGLVAMAFIKRHQQG